MRQECNSQSIKIFKSAAAYLFLYATFIGIFYHFAYEAWLCVKPIGLMLVLIEACFFLLLYALINHIIIRKIVGLKTVVIFETILILVIIVLTCCYINIENRFHGDYSAPLTYHEEIGADNILRESLKIFVARNHGATVNDRLNEKFLISGESPLINLGEPEYNIVRPNINP